MSRRSICASTTTINRTARSQATSSTACRCGSISATRWASRWSWARSGSSRPTWVAPSPLPRADAPGQAVGAVQRGRRRRAGVGVEQGRLDPRRLRHRTRRPGPRGVWPRAGAGTAPGDLDPWFGGTGVVKLNVATGAGNVPLDEDVADSVVHPTARSLWSRPSTPACSSTRAPGTATTRTSRSAPLNFDGSARPHVWGRRVRASEPGRIRRRDLSLTGRSRWPRCRRIYRDHRSGPRLPRAPGVVPAQCRRFAPDLTLRRRHRCRASARQRRVPQRGQSTAPGTDPRGQRRGQLQHFLRASLLRQWGAGPFVRIGGRGERDRPGERLSRHARVQRRPADRG